MARTGLQQFNAEIKLYEAIPVSSGVNIAFSTDAKRETYMATKRFKTISNCKNIKFYNDTNGVIRLNLTKTEIDKAAYISFKNPNYTDKLIYAQLVFPPTYINNETYEFQFFIDPLLSYQHDITCKPYTSITRQHLSESDAATAATNPWDPSLWQLRTPESITYGKSIEPLNYDFSTDGGSIFNTSLMQDGSETSILLYLSMIDLDALDKEYVDSTDTPVATDYPSYKFEAYLTNGADFYFDPRDGVYHSTANVIPNNYYNTQNFIIAWSGGSRTCLGNTKSGLLHLNDFIKLITTWNCVSAILNMYKMPTDLLDHFSVNVLPSLNGETTTIAAPTISHDPKLYNFPFSYLRIITPSDDQKEYQYEKFLDLQQGDSSFDFYSVTDISERPIIITAPLSYENTNIIPAAPNDFDIKNAIIFSQIPTAPYIIDAYTAQMASTAASLIASHTTEKEISLKIQEYQNEANIIQTEYGAASSYAGVVGESASALSLNNINPSGLLSAFGNAASADERMKAAMGQQLKTAYEQDIYADAGSMLIGNTEGAAARNYRRTKAAYAANQYIKPNGDGFMHYSAYDFFDFLYVHVHPIDYIADQYDKYFSVYGYYSGAVDTPYICNFLKNSNDTTKLPDWRTQADGLKTTYIQTANAEFSGAPINICKFFERAFDTGMIWINGDLL